MARRARVIAASLVLGVATALAGCSASEEVVPYTAETAALDQGETLVVDFGEINLSVGDGWVVVTGPDPAVLGPAEASSTYRGDEGSVGGPSEYSYRFPAVGEGTTIVEFEYRFRGEVPEDPADRETARLEVTVE